MVSNFSCHWTLYLSFNSKSSFSGLTSTICLSPNCLCIITSIYVIYARIYTTLRAEKSGFACQPMAMLRRLYVGSLSGTGRKLSMSASYRAEISHRNLPLSLTVFRPETTLCLIDFLLIFFKHPFALKKNSHNYLLKHYTVYLLFIMFNVSHVSPSNRQNK